MHPAEIASEPSSPSLQSIIDDGKGDAEGAVMENEGQRNNEDDSRGIRSDPPSSMRNFYAIASTYLIFTLTDSALRMIVLLELFKRGFGAFELAIMFTLYELLGVLTNLLGGILGSRIGLKPCLLAGLFSQLCSLLFLFFLSSSWSRFVVIVYIAISQGFSGIAKDLVKMSGKSITKLVTKESDSGGPLFRLVAHLTGAKNSIKGIGYFLGSVILIPGFYVALGILTGVTSVVAIPSWIFVDSGLGISKSGEKLTLKRIFRKDRNVTILSLSRFFLFGSRDSWFEIALPVYLRGVLEWSYYQTGLFLAVWVIIYGIVQSSTPKFILQPLKMYPLTSAKPLIFWTGILALVTLLNSLLFTFVRPSVSYAGTVVSLVMGLGLFAIVFAVNSSIHSYLILKFSNRDKVAVNVGFYYMANSMGRLVGTIVSGVMYVETGLMGCLWISLGFVVVGEIVNLLLL